MRFRCVANWISNLIAAGGRFVVVPRDTSDGVSGVWSTENVPLPPSSMLSKHWRRRQRRSVSGCWQRLPSATNCVCPRLPLPQSFLTSSGHFRCPQFKMNSSKAYFTNGRVDFLVLAFILVPSCSSARIPMNVKKRSADVGCWNG